MQIETIRKFSDELQQRKDTEIQQLKAANEQLRAKSKQELEITKGLQSTIAAQAETENYVSALSQALDKHGMAVRAEYDSDVKHIKAVFDAMFKHNREFSRQNTELEQQTTELIGKVKNLNTQNTDLTNRTSQLNQQFQSLQERAKELLEAMRRRDRDEAKVAENIPEYFDDLQYEPFDWGVDVNTDI